MYYQNTLEGLWDRFADFLPALLSALLVLLVGWLIAEIVAWLVDRLLRAVQVPTLARFANVDDFLKRSGSTHDVVSLLASIAKWALILVAFIAAAEVLNLNTVSTFLNEVIGYLPNVFGAAAILLLGMAFAQFLRQLVFGALSGAAITYAEMVSGVVKYAVIVFAVLAALHQLGIAQPFLQALFYAFVSFLALAGGLAFGLGGKDVAARWLDRLSADFEGKKSR